MSDSESRLAQDRASRAAARGLFDRRLTQVKADLSSRGIGGRIKAKAVQQGEEAVAQGLEIARENRGIIAATGAALALWFLRRPLIMLVGRFTRRGQDAVQEPDDITAE
ncbi:MAG: hypothetical protein WBL74_10120 [Novosphingobium sp.]|uniref:hypothetical protein n=1 Tax=Novosphingobium sp. TaxID=1874826 RepID=UPI003C7E8BF5